MKFCLFVDARGKVPFFEETLSTEKNCDSTDAEPKSPRNITSRNANKLFKLWQPLVKPVPLINRKNTLRKVKLSIWIEWKGPNLNRIKENSHSQRKNNQAEVTQPGGSRNKFYRQFFSKYRPLDCLHSTKHTKSKSAFWIPRSCPRPPTAKRFLWNIAVGGRKSVADTIDAISNQ